MDVGFLFGWAKEQGVKVPTKSDGSANINELFALYNEWKKKGGESKAESSGDGSNKEKRNDKDDKPEVVELDENSELARLIASSDRNKYDTIRRYLIENFGGRELELSDGKKAVIDKSDAKELAHKAYDKRVSELSELEKLVKYATFIKQVGDVEHNKFQAFRYYIVKTKYKGNIGRIVLNVGIDKNAGKLHLYSITNYPKDK